MEHNEIISAEQLIDIINEHGVGLVSVDGEMPYEYEDAEALELDGSEAFKVAINYSNEVQFILMGSESRAWLTTGLKGKVVNMEWVA